MRLEQETERFRLQAVERYKELELSQDKKLQEIVQVASYIFQAPIALITLMDKDVQWVISKTGADIEQLPRATSFCTHAIEQELPLVVPDATADGRFTNLPVVAMEPHLKFYAGASLKSVEGYNVGTLCVFDNKPRDVTQEQINCLQALTNQVSNLLELKLTLKVLNDSIGELTRQNTLLQKIAQVQSHDLRAPVASIMGIMNVIKYDNYQPKREYLEMMEGVVEELDTKVRNIVKLASNNNEGYNNIDFPVAI